MQAVLELTDIDGPCTTLCPEAYQYVRNHWQHVATFGQNDVQASTGRVNN